MDTIKHRMDDMGSGAGGRQALLPVTLAVMLLLAACAEQPRRPASDAPEVPAVSAPAAPPPDATPPAPAEPPVAAEAPAPAEPPAPAPASPYSPQEAPRAIAAAIDLLQGGQEEQALAELNRVLAGDANNRQALGLIKQIKDDPVASLGRESFPYRVQPGETLSRIAQRFLNDLQLFYILARYNNIKVPRSLAEGQTIRVPGKAPPAPAAAPGGPSPAPAPAAPPPAPAAAAAAPAASPAAPEPAAVSPAQQRADAIARHTRDARSAFAKQDLDAAIRSWDEVLKLDPGNRTAFLEKEKVVGLREKLKKLK